MSKELKRKGKAIGVKPRATKVKEPTAPNSVRLDASDTPIAKPTMTLTQRLVIAWMDKATILNLLPSEKKYKEAQLEFMLDIANKIGDKFPSEIMEILNDNGDCATLLNKREAIPSKNTKRRG